MKNLRFNNSKDYLRQLTTIAYLNMSIPLLLFGWLYLEASTHRLEPRVDPKNIVWIFSILTLMSVFLLYLGNKLYYQKLSIAQSINTLVEKLLIYKKAVYWRFLFFGIAGLIITLGIYITASELFAISFSIVIVLFSINNPSLIRIAKALKLKDKEKEIILRVKSLNTNEHG